MTVARGYGLQTALVDEKVIVVSYNATATMRVDIARANLRLLPYKGCCSRCPCPPYCDDNGDDGGYISGDVGTWVWLCDGPLDPAA